MKKAEINERAYLSKIKEKLQTEYTNINSQLEAKRKEIKADTVYRGEARSDMDHGEKITFRQIIEEKVAVAEGIIKRLKKIDKLKLSPYFGRFDFVKEGESQETNVYLGIHNFYDYEAKKPLIYDWRAPIASMFYNHEIGSADYESPAGKVSGDVTLKRQFRIRDGEMDYMLESDVNIVDDVLQKELSRTSDEGMKNIVATIQRDQNDIIRNEDSSVLIIQGVAGSGKTSIALHRIAFLLYRFKETLKSEDILIISPNKVFASYISNVLPELGEESVSEIQMEALAEELLGSSFKFQTFFEQSAELLETEDEALKERIKTKSSSEFLETLENYVKYVKAKMFVGRDVIVGDCFVPAWLFDEVFELYSSLPRKESINEITKRIKQKIDLEYRYTLEPSETTYLKKKVNRMHKGLTLRQTYIDMFSWMDKPELFKLIKGSKFEYADVFPLLYLKIHLEGKGIRVKAVKHLLIDEMQDYSPVQYEVIKKLFKCNKTILGDLNQSINPYSSSTSETIRNIFDKSLAVELNKSYRSSYEIMEFVQKISHNPNLKVIERHGDEPKVLSFKSEEFENQEIFKIAKEFSKSNFNSLGVICKTQKQAKKIYSQLQALNINSYLLTGDSDFFSQGVIVCTAHMAKGLEFDQVLVPKVNDSNYSTLMDKSLLYVACTRAMHKLTLTHSGPLTKLIDNN